MLTRKPEDDLGVKYFSSSKDKELRAAIKNQRVKYTILQEYDDAKVCWRAEQQLIALYWKFFGKDMSYNHARGTINGGYVWSTAGTSHSTETKEKIGKANRGRKHSIKQNLEHSKVMKGRKLDDDVKERISNTMKERFKTHTHPTTGKTPWNKGHTGIPKQKFYWQTPEGEIKTMSKPQALQHHLDWTLIGPVENNENN
jgi:hypothetical protein